MGRMEDKILKILSQSNDLSEDVSWETVGGPSPSETLKGPLDYAKPVTKATVPQAHPIPGVGEIGSDDAGDDDPITDVIDSLEGDGDGFENMDGSGDDDDDDDDDEEDDDIEETFKHLLSRLAEDEEGETSLKDDNGGEPDETLPDVESDLDSPDKLVTKAPGIKVAEEEEGETSLSDNGGEPKETLPGASVDSLTDQPDKLVTKAPGAKTPDTVVEDEEDGDGDDKFEKFKKKSDDGAGDDDEDDKKTDEEKAEEVKEDIKAIFSGIKLAETTKQKAAMIYTAAVTRRVNEEKYRVQKIATRKLKEAFEILKMRAAKKQNVFESALTEQVDQYLNYTVENWLKENRLAVERGIRAELAEDFIAGLKNLFVEHYIEVPESKVDIVETLGKKVTQLESKLNETTETNVKMRASLNTYRKEEVVRAVSGGLAETQREKLKKLAEGVEYTTRKEFAEKLVNLKEAYFPKKSTPVRKEAPASNTLTESATKPATTTDPEMALYVRTLRKTRDQ